MDRLRALQKQARWGDPELSSLRDVDALSAQRLIQALARHLLPLAEALEEMLPLDIRHGDCTRPNVLSPCSCGAEEARDAANEALKALQDALK